MQSMPVQCGTEGWEEAVRAVQYSQRLQSAAEFQGMRNEGRLTPMWGSSRFHITGQPGAFSPNPSPPHSLPPSPFPSPRDILSVATMTTGTSSPLTPPMLLLLLVLRTGRRKASRLAARTSSRMASW